MRRLRRIIRKWFVFEPKLLKNIEEYGKKEKAKQQKP